MRTKWNQYAKDVLKNMLTEKGLTTTGLANLFSENGSPETKASIDNKLSRGTFSASFLYECFSYLNNGVYDPENALDTGHFLRLPNCRGNQYYSSRTKIRYIDPKDNQNLKLKNNDVVSLFAGAGGFDIGLERAGFSTVACVEIDEHCRETLRFNRPDWGIFECKNNRAAGDIRKISGKELLQFANIEKGALALVVGGAPCQPFSNIGLKRGKSDPANGDLFLEFVRMVSELEPKAFIFENVTGITQSKHFDVVDYMKKSFTDIGYEISYTVLNAADYGVPQKRQRFIILGLKGNVAPLFPMPSHAKCLKEWSSFVDSLDNFPDYLPREWVGVGDALSKLPSDYKNREDYKLMNISDVVRKRMELIGPGENFKVLPMKMRPNCWKSGKHAGQDTFGRLRLEEPSVTIRTAAYNPSKGKYIHPNENRGLDLVEMAALQSFPIDWQFRCTGGKQITLKSGGAQIGNAVPPKLSESIGEALKVQLSYLE